MPKSERAGDRESWPPEFVGSYRIDRTTCLGRGAGGHVYRGEDRVTGAPVVVKFLATARMRPSGADTGAVERFLHEASVGRHLNVGGRAAAVRDVGIDSERGAVYLVYEALECESLAVWLGRERARQDLRARVRVAIEVCVAVSRMHALGLFHRDIKPDNLLILPNGTVEVIDFGLTVREDGEPRAAGRTDGTPGYMPPEQEQGRFAGAASDQYSVGVILTALFAPPSPTPPDWQSDRRLAKITLRAIEDGPNKRYPTVADLGADLQDWLETEERESLAVASVECRPHLCLVRAPDPREMRRAHRRDEAQAMVSLVAGGIPAFDHNVTAHSPYDVTTAMHVAGEAARWDLRTVGMARLYVALARHLVGKGRLRLPALWYSRACDILRPHADHATRLELAELLNEYGCHQWNFGQRQKGLLAAQEAYNIWSELLGPDDPLTNRGLNNLAEAQYKKGNASVALEMHAASYAKEKARDSGGNEFGWRCGNWGKLLVAAGQVEKGMRVIKRGIRVKSRALADDHTEVAYLLNHLAAALDASSPDQHAAAIAAYERSRRIRERAFGEASCSALLVRNLQAESHYQRGEYAAAKRLTNLFADLPFIEDSKELARGLELHLILCRRLRQSKQQDAEFLGRIGAIRAFIYG